MKKYFFLAIRYNNSGVSEYVQRKRNKEDFPNKKLRCVWIRNKCGVWTSCRIREEKEV